MQPRRQDREAAQHEMTPMLNNLPPPRKVRRTKKYITTLQVFAFCMFSVYPWWVIPEGIKYVNVSRLIHSGIMTTAVVTDSRAENHFRAGTIDMLTVRFTDLHNRTVSSDTEVSHNVYLNTSIGDNVPLTYLPTNTDICKVGKVTSADLDAVARDFLIGFGLMLGFEMCLVGGIILDDRRQTSLLRDGVVVEARVLRASRAGQYYYDMRYEIDSKGMKIRRTDRIDRRVRAMPQDGETIDVLCLPNRPSQCKAVAAAINFEVVE